MRDLKQILYDIFQIKGDLWGVFFLAAIIVVIATIILAFRYRIIITSLNTHMRFSESFNITCLSQFISYLSPFRMGAIFTKPFLTRVISSVPFKKSMWASVFDQFFDLLWQVLLLPILLYIVGREYLRIVGFFNLAALAALIGCIIVMVLHSDKVIGFVWKFKFVVPRPIIEFSNKKNISKKRILELIEKSKEQLKNKRMLFSMSALTFVHFLLAGFVLELFLLYFSYHIPYLSVLAAFWAAAIIGRLSGLPAGLGTRDVSLGAFLVAYGVSVGDSVKIVVVVRLSILAATAVLGILFIAYNSLRIKNFNWVLRKREE